MTFAPLSSVRWRTALTVVLAVLVCGPACAREEPVFRTKISGSGPDVLLLPGLASSMEVWDETAAWLDDTRRVHQFTLAGFAGVPPVPGPVLETRVEALTEYIDSLGTGPVTLAGHSLGGVLAMMIAERRPGLVDRLIIVDSLPFVAELFFRAGSVDEAKPIADGLRRTQKLQPQIAFYTQQKAGLASLTKRPERLSVMADWLEASDKDTMIDALHAMLTTDLRDRIDVISAKTTIIFGHDRFMPITAEALADLYKRQYAEIPDHTITRVDGSFHFVMYDQPEAFRAAFEAGLAPVPAPAPAAAAPVRPETVPAGDL